VCSENFKLLSRIKGGSKKSLTLSRRAAIVLIRPVHRKAQLRQGQEGWQELSHDRSNLWKCFAKAADIRTVISGTSWLWKYRTMCYRYFVIVGQGCTILVRLVARTTTCFALAPNIFRVMTAVFVTVHSEICISSHSPSTKRQITVKSRGHYRPVGPQIGACFV